MLVNCNDRNIVENKNISHFGFLTQIVYLTQNDNSECLKVSHKHFKLLKQNADDRGTDNILGRESERDREEPTEAAAQLSSSRFD